GVFTNTSECRTATVRSRCQDPWLFYSAKYNALQGELERYSARAYSDFELTDHVKLFGDFSYAKSVGIGIFQPAFSNAAGGGTMPISIRGDNAYLNGSSALAGQLRQAWTDAGLALNQATAAQVGKFWPEFGNRNSDTARRNYRAISGLEGDFSALDR